MIHAVSARKGNWIETFTGRQFYPLDPRPEDVDIEDIAHALSLICRFNGHTKYHYSVAQHSVYCAQLALSRGYTSLVALYALLHDAAEAYCCDIPRPLKPSLTDYAAIEDGIMAVIYARYGLTVPREDMHKIIKQLDDAVLCSEARTLMSKHEWVPAGKNVVRIRPMYPLDAQVEFMWLWRELGPKEDGEGAVK